MFSVIWAKVGKWVGALVAGLLLLASVFYSGRKSGETKAKGDAAEERANEREAIAVRQVNEAREASEHTTKAVQNANEVASNNSMLIDDEVTKRLRDEWSRD